MFLGSILADADDGKDLRHVTSEYSVTWRDFLDKKHRALWRVMETVDLLTYEERLDVLFDEAYAEPVKANQMLDAPGDDLVAGAKGSAQHRQFMDEIARNSKVFAWLERELDKNGVYYLVGGREYLRELHDRYSLHEGFSFWFANSPELTREDICKRLGFIKNEKKNVN